MLRSDKVKKIGQGRQIRGACPTYKNCVKNKLNLVL